MWILGLSGSHNGAAALIRDGKVEVAIQAERLTRTKRDRLKLHRLGQSAVDVVDYCLDFAGINLEELACVATNTPWRNITPSFAPEVRARIEGGAGGFPRFVTVPHHLAHAEYAIHYSPMTDCLVLVCDGSGTYDDQRVDLDIKEQPLDPKLHLRGEAKESISAYAFRDQGLGLIYRVAYGPSEPLRKKGEKGFDSFGHLWRWVAEYCHGDRSEAGKVMGLAPYGDPNVHSDLEYIRLASDGRVEIDFSVLQGRFQTPNTSRRDVGGDKHYADLAAHLQDTTNRFLLELVRYLQTLYRTEICCYAGGVALNGIANEFVAREADLDLLANGSCEDNGTAIGAALAAHHALTGERVAEAVTDYYGRTYGIDEIARALRRRGLPFRRLEPDAALEWTAAALAAGKVVGWFQGRSEFGPRALGNRSILADPRRPEIQDVVNRKVKFRESFRPFAPAVLAERAQDFFCMRGLASPVMLRVVPVKVDCLPGITHVDGSARVQTVTREQNVKFHDLIRRFDAIAGVPVLLNTSFNLAGEPIVETPEDAIRTFLASNMDALVMNDAVIEKSDIAEYASFTSEPENPSVI